MTSREDVAVPVPGGHLTARLEKGRGDRLPVAVIGDGLHDVVAAHALAEAGFLVVDLAGNPSQGRAWWESIAAFARRQREADAARLVLAGAGQDVYTLRDLAPTLDPVVLALAPSWRPRPVATLLRRARTVLELDQRAVGPDELTCPVVVTRDRPVPRWLTGVDLHRVHPEELPRTLHALVTA